VISAAPQRLTAPAAAPGFMVPARRVLALGLVAGYVDALGFVDLHGIYTAAMTGNTVQLGITFFQAQWPHFALIAGTLGAFFFGGLFSSLIRQRLRRPAVELVIMAGLLLLAQMVRRLAPGTVALELPLLAISMAMQGETVSRFGGLSIQTIVVTNTMLKFADALVGRYVRFGRQPDGARPGLADVVVPACAWFAYTVGAGSGGLAATSLTLPLLVPAVLLGMTACDLLYSSNPDEK